MSEVTELHPPFNARLRRERQVGVLRMMLRYITLDDADRGEDYLNLLRDNGLLSESEHGSLHAELGLDRPRQRPKLGLPRRLTLDAPAAPRKPGLCWENQNDGGDDAA